MNTNASQGSAKIYQFPTSAERAGRTRTTSEAPKPAMAVGESWYHEAAVQQEARAKSVIVPISFPRQ